MREETGLDFVPSDVVEMMEILSRAGHEAWLVGGALRDHLLGKPPKDFDLATDAPCEEVMRLFPRVIPVGIRYGTVQIHTRKRDVEVTSYPGGGPEGILADLGRRDFTVNALAVSYRDRTVLDPHGGRDDAGRQVLRAVGDAGRRFREDPLRVLRAFRFVSMLGFEIEPATHAALRSEAKGLDRVAGERVREEIFKILSGGHVVKSLRLMQDSRVLHRLLPELAEAEHAGTIDTIGRCPKRLTVRLAALLRGLAKEGTASGGAGQSGCGASCPAAEAVMGRWRMSRRQIRDVLTLLENPVPDDAADWTDAQLRRFIARAGAEFVGGIVELDRARRGALGVEAAGSPDLCGLYRRLRQEVDGRTVPQMKDLAVTGEDVMRVTGIKPGPRVGEMLEKAFLEVLGNPSMNDRKILMDFIRKEFDKESNIETS